MGQVSPKGIRKSYGDVPVIKGIDLEVRDGEFLVFVGPSGCGKSTTLPAHRALWEALAGAGHHRIEAGQPNGLAPDAAWALAFDAQHRLTA